MRDQMLHPIWLATAILEIGHRSMSHDVVDELFELSDLENVGLSVGITSVTTYNTTSGLAVAILDIDRRSIIPGVGDKLFELSGLENVGLAAGITLPAFV
jgi:hypothetical protein